MMRERVKKVFLLMLVTIATILVLALCCSGFEFRSRRMEKKMRNIRPLRLSHPYESPSYEEKHVRTKKFIDEGNLSLITDGPFNASLNDVLQQQIEKGLIVGGSELKRRTKRTVYAWPPNTIFIAQFSLEMPLYTPEGVGLPVLIEVPYEFDLPNVTETLITGKSMKQRLSFFGTMEALFQRFGFNGKECVFRAICERAEAHVMTSGLLGEILNLILAVSATAQDSHILEDYLEAEHHGRSIGDCQEKYKKCPISIFHFLD